MAATGRRPDPPLIQTLSERAAAFDFFQAVRLLEALGAKTGRRPVGFDHEPRTEAARLKGDPSLAFPAGELRDVRGLGVPDRAAPPDVRVTFLGFLGASGVLPQHYSELVVRRVQQKDTAFLDWLDLLLHRTLSLLHRAWWKHRPAFSFEQARRHPDVRDPVELMLRALAGIATGKLAGRQAIDDETLLFFAGHLASRRRSAAALARAAGAWLRAPTRLREFVGRDLPLDVNDRSRLPGRSRTQGVHARLGRDLVLGTSARDVSGKVRLEVGPLAHPDYLALLPGGASHAGLRDLVRTFAGVGIDCDLQVSFRKETLPSARLAGRKTPGCGLGRDAWLGEPRNARLVRSELFPLTAA